MSKIYYDSLNRPCAEATISIFHDYFAKTDTFIFRTVSNAPDKKMGNNKKS
jgi:hypothetical protein